MANSSSLSSLERELDLYKIETEVKQALEAAARGDIIPGAVSLESMPLPATPLAEKTTKYAKESVDPLVFTHSLRTYYFGTAIATAALPHLEWDPHTFYLASLLHDIACTHHAFHESLLSFEIHGGMLAHTFLLREGASREVADTVMEAICRHKEFGEDTWGHSPVGEMLRMGAQLDVLGNYSGLINKDTIQEVVQKYPRHDFGNVFADLLVEEVKVKRYCTTVAVVKGGRIDVIRNNPLFP